MNLTKKLVRHLLFAALAATAGLFGAGCFTAETWNHLGKTETSLPEGSLRYRITPDGNEIVFSARQKTAHYCWPLIHCVDSNRGHSKYTWNTCQSLEKRVSLDSRTDPRWTEPAPTYRGNLVRFHLVVVPDPAVPRARIEDDSTPYFETPAEHTEEGNAPPKDVRRGYEPQYYVSPGETLRLRIHPDDLPLLSDHQNLLLKISKRQTDETPGFNGSVLVCPAAQDGSSYDMLAYRGNDYLHEGFWDGLRGESSTGVAGYCWKVLWMPAAVVADVIALPVYLINPAIIMHNP